jgi:hypothetical protein
MYLPGMGAIVDRHDAVFKFNLYNLGARPGKCAPEAAPWAQSYVHGTQYVGGQVLFVPIRGLVLWPFVDSGAVPQWVVQLTLSLSVASLFHASSHL